METKILNIEKISADVNGKIIMEAHFDDEIFVLINLCNSNTKVKQVKILCGLNQMLGKLSLVSCKRVIFAGDFFNSNLGVKTLTGNRSLKTKSL